jgi:hypothetical protein
MAEEALDKIAANARRQESKRRFAPVDCRLYDKRYQGSEKANYAHTSH